MHIYNNETAVLGIIPSLRTILKKDFRTFNAAKALLMPVFCSMLQKSGALVVCWCVQATVDHGVTNRFNHICL